MRIADPVAAERYAAESGLKRLLENAAQRYRSLGRVGGTATLERLAPAEARALGHLRLTGRTLPRAGSDVRIELARLDRALVDAGGLLTVLRAAGQELTTAAQRRADEASVRDLAWARALDAAVDPREAAWVEELRRARGGTPPAALPAVLAALAALERNAWDRAQLATEAFGDPHALDDGTAAAGLLVAALSHREQTVLPGRAAARRALLARHGIRSDPHSSTVLVLGLRTTGRGPAAKLLAAVDGGHIVLTLAQLDASRLRPPRGVVRTCEGPVVVRAAEERLGRRLRGPLICTEGQPSAACDALLRKLSGAVQHSGDFEWGGLRIASLMRRRYRATTWRHDVADYDAALTRIADRASRLTAPRGTVPEGVEPLWRRLEQRRVPVWQEDLLDALIEDLARAATAPLEGTRPGRASRR